MTSPLSTPRAPQPPAPPPMRRRARRRRGDVVAHRHAHRDPARGHRPARRRRRHLVRDQRGARDAARRRDDRVRRAARGTAAGADLASRTACGSSSSTARRAGRRRFSAGRDADARLQRRLPRSDPRRRAGRTGARRRDELAWREPTTVHWHGMHLPAAMDGGPHSPIAAGGTWQPGVDDRPAGRDALVPPAPARRARGTGRRGSRRHVPGARRRGGARSPLPREYGVDDLPVIVQDRSFAPTGRSPVGSGCSSTACSATRSW